jgi:hypothetical protein
MSTGRFPKTLITIERLIWLSIQTMQTNWTFKFRILVLRNRSSIIEGIASFSVISGAKKSWMFFFLQNQGQDLNHDHRTIQNAKSKWRFVLHEIAIIPLDVEKTSTEKNVTARHILIWRRTFWDFMSIRNYLRQPHKACCEQ